MPTFVDQTKIEVQAGKGGDGMVASAMKNTSLMAVQPVVMVAVAAVLFLLLTAA